MYLVRGRGNGGRLLRVEIPFPVVGLGGLLESRKEGGSRRMVDRELKRKKRMREREDHVILVEELLGL